MLEGRDLARLKRRDVPKIRRRIGIVFQDFKLLPNKSVREQRGLRPGGDGHASGEHQARG